MLIQMIQADSDAQTVRESLHAWFERFEALAYTRQRAEDFATLARREIAPLPHSAAKTALEQVTQFVVRRAH
jgi:geranylgeranyl pyrophosphate synthase